MSTLLNALKSCGNRFENSYTVANMSEKDCPLVYVNDFFEIETGYRPEESVGRNCRFLQGEQTNDTCRDHIRESIKNKECCAYDILNYKKSGERFINRLTLIPFYDGKMHFYYVGIQLDVSKKYNIDEFQASCLKASSEALLAKVKHPLAKIVSEQRAQNYSFYSESNNFDQLEKSIIEEVGSIVKYMGSL